MIAAAAGACIVAFMLGVAAELGCRAWFRRYGDFVWRPFERSLMHLDTGSLPGMPAVARFEVNRDGERGGEPPRPWDKAWRVLVAGGSAAECYYLDQPHSWPEVLAQELREANFLKKVGRLGAHVGNIGKSGLDLSGVNLTMDRTLGRYRSLDCIVLFVGAGDVSNWLCDGAPDPFPAGKAPTNLFAVRCDRSFGWSARKCALADVARLIHCRLVPKCRQGVGKKLREVRAMRRNAAALITSVPDPSGMLSFFEENLKETLLKAKRKAPHVIVVRQPWFDKEVFSPEEEVLLWHAAKGKPYEQQVDTYFSYGVFNELMRAVDMVTVAVCSQTATPVLDLKSLLPNSTVTYYDHLHFTSEGARLVGKAVADFVKEVVSDAGSSR